MRLGRGRLGRKPLRRGHLYRQIKTRDYRKYHKSSLFDFPYMFLVILILQVRIVAAQALTTMAIRSGEPYRLQIYEFLHTLAQGGVQSQLSEMHLSNGEDQGASGTGLGVLISPMIKVLDEMYKAQDDLIK